MIPRSSLLALRSSNVLLTQTGFNRLLEFLDSDREIAAQKYERIQRKLVKFFEWRTSSAAEELADATIDRVIRRLLEGEEIRASDPSAYFYGVARYVAHEWWAAHKEPVRSVERMAPDRGDSPSLIEDQERRSHCLDQCLDRLPAEARRLILDYYQSQGRQKIQNRQQLALRLQISSSALRLRAQRIREQLEKCVHDLLAQARDDTF